MRPLLALCLAFTAALAAEEPHAIAAADLEQAAKDLRAEVGDGFTIVIEAPFVVAGDSAAQRVRGDAEGIVRWAATLLRKDFFPADPDGIYRVYLFKDKDSYRANAKRLFHEEPDSPYGYCSPARHALVMNIATGGGTLVHEMVHSFMHGNVADCPDWLNEGLASLFEQCGERDGHIIGRVNWRLPILKKALADGTAPSWEKLAGFTDGAFYSDDRGANYATARYTLMWLQERGLLRTFWSEWTAHRADDAGGLKTLAKQFPGKDLATLQAEWKAWVGTLPDP
jgi:hypothetical protein